jgi:hypothetical protein
MAFLFVNNLNSTYFSIPNTVNMALKAQADPKAWAVYEQRNRMYALMDNLGFEEMPQEVYQSWLKSLNAEKQRQAVERQKLIQKSQE